MSSYGPKKGASERRDVWFFVHNFALNDLVVESAILFERKGLRMRVVYTQVNSLRVVHKWSIGRSAPWHLLGI